MGDLMGDVGQLAAMADHFDKIQKLKDPIAGCPNFRRVPGYKVYCCGQPTVAGFEAALNKVMVAFFYFQKPVPLPRGNLLLRCVEKRTQRQGRLSGST